MGNKLAWREECQYSNFPAITDFFLDCQAANECITDDLTHQYLLKEKCHFKNFGTSNELILYMNYPHGNVCPHFWSITIS